MRKDDFEVKLPASRGKMQTRRGVLKMSSAAFLFPGRSLADPHRFIRFSEFLANRMAGSQSAAFIDAAMVAVVEKKILQLDQPVELSQKWSPPPGLVLRGDYTESALIRWVGEGDAIEVTGPIDIDGITIDGGLDPASDRTAGDYGCLVAVHGSLGERPSYLSGIKIGRLRIRRTRSVALVLANLVGAQIDELELSDIFCNGLIVSGVSSGVFRNIFARNIGDLRESGHRRGSAIAIFAETKPVSSWYSSSSILETKALRFGKVRIENTTDSAFYIHDELKRGVEDIEIRELRINTAGKDGFKTRVGPKKVRIGIVEVENAALRGVDIESDETWVDKLSVLLIGGDAVGSVLGRASAYSGGKAAHESIQTHPNGVLVMNCSDVEVRSLEIRDVHCNPVTGAEGHGLHLANATRVKMSGVVSGCGGNGLRMAGCREFSLALAIDDTCREAATGSAALLTSDGMGPSFRGSLHAVIRQGVRGRARRAITASAACDVDFAVDFDPREFDGSTFEPRRGQERCGQDRVDGRRE